MFVSLPALSSFLVIYKGSEKGLLKGEYRFHVSKLCGNSWAWLLDITASSTHLPPKDIKEKCYLETLGFKSAWSQLNRWLIIWTLSKMWEIGVSTICKLLQNGCGRLKDRNTLENTKGQEEAPCLLQNSAEERSKMVATSQREVSALPESIELVANRIHRLSLLSSLGLSGGSGIKTGKYGKWEERWRFYRKKQNRFHTSWTRRGKGRGL